MSKLTEEQLIKNPHLISRWGKSRPGICKCGRPTWDDFDGAYLCRKCRRHPNGKRK